MFLSSEQSQVFLTSNTVSSFREVFYCHESGRNPVTYHPVLLVFSG